jgi:phosphopantetheine adenylyltransferase
MMSAGRARAALGRLESATPGLVTLSGGEIGADERVALFPGTYDPATIAHVAVAESALEHADVVLLTVPVVSVDKEHRGGLVDRIEAVCRAAARHDRLGVAVTNVGLYVDLARVASDAFGRGRVDLVCGADKLAQIMRPEYYPDRDAGEVMRSLLSAARILAAPRRGHSLPEGLPGLVVLDVASEYHSISSSDVREGVARGEDMSRFLA